VTIVLGVMPRFVGYFNHFQRHNPALLAHLSRALDVCRTHVPSKVR
jgi:hypothetical protein